MLSPFFLEKTSNGCENRFEKTRALILRVSEYRALNITYIVVDAQYKVFHCSFRDLVLLMQITVMPPYRNKNDSK